MEEESTTLISKTNNNNGSGTSEKPQRKFINFYHTSTTYTREPTQIHESESTVVNLTLNLHHARNECKLVYLHRDAPFCY